jgi:SAM-dependent methyltransferase
MFSRAEYRRVIAWPERIRREAPFLASVFGNAAELGLPLRLLDIGCGSGEHAHHFAELGWTAVGIDISEAMIESAQEIAGPTEAGGSARYEQRDGADSAGLEECPFGGALFLGNGAAFLPDRAALDGLFRGVAAALAPGAPLLLQTLNYHRIQSAPVRALPVNVRPLPEEDGGGEVVLIRILDPGRSEEFVEFYPISLHLVPNADPDGEPTVTVRNAKQLRHRAWKRADFEASLAAAGFGEVEWFGGMKREPFVPEESHDLVFRATRS